MEIFIEGITEARFLGGFVLGEICFEVGFASLKVRMRGYSEGFCGIHVS